MRLAVVLAVLALTPGCKKEAPASKQDPPPTTAPDAGAKKVEASTRTTVFLDTLKIGEVDVGQASTYPPLHAMLPPGFANLESWSSIEVRGSNGLVQKLVSPAKTHPGEVAAIFPTGGGVAFGFFSPEGLAKKSQPKESIASVVEIRVRTPEFEAGGQGGEGGGDGGGGGDEGGERPVPTKDLKIAIKVGGKDVVFDGEQLAKVKTTTAPIGDMDTPGWTIPAVLEAAGVNLEKLKGKLVMYGDEGANLILELADLDPEESVAFIKLNRQGKLRFRLFRKVGTTWEVVGELRGIASIESK